MFGHDGSFPFQLPLQEVGVVLPGQSFPFRLFFRFHVRQVLGELLRSDRAVPIIIEGAEEHAELLRIQFHVQRPHLLRESFGVQVGARRELPQLLLVDDEGAPG